MTATVRNFVGQRLTEARRARGLSATDLAAMIGVSVQSVSKYENGRQFPKLDMLHTLSSVLRMPRDYFLRPITETDEKPVFWRGKLSAPPKMRERAAVRLEWLKEIVDYLAGYFEFPPLNVPHIPLSDLDKVDLDFLEDAATAIREHWGVRPGPIPDVLEKLELNGILVSRIYVDAEKLNAFSQWSDRFGIPFIVLGRDKSSAVRQRFDALHELAHLVIHRSIGSRQLNNRASYKAIEKQADRLACCLLLPEQEFVEELYAPTLDGFLTLKERWGTSVGAMIMRCKELDLIDEDQAKRMWINYNRRGWRKGEPLDNKMEKERPYMLRRSFEMLLAEEVQSASDILRALPFPAAEIEEIADLDPGTLLSDPDGRPDPILKPEHQSRDTSNVVSMFGKDRR